MKTADQRLALLAVEQVAAEVAEEVDQTSLIPGGSREVQEALQ